jgi:hypothetical protein
MNIDSHLICLVTLDAHQRGHSLYHARFINTLSVSHKVKDKVLSEGSNFGTTQKLIRSAGKLYYQGWRTQTDIGCRFHGEFPLANNFALRPGYGCI